MQIEANIRVLFENQQVQINDHIYNDFYKKYQQFDSILVNQESAESVEKICQKSLENILNNQDILFITLTNRKIMLPNRRNSMKLQQQKSILFIEQLQLIKYCYEEIKKKSQSAFEQKQKIIACSFIEIRKDIVKDIAKHYANQKESILNYHNNQNHNKISIIPIQDVCQIQDIYSRGLKLQQKNKNLKKNEAISSVLRLSIMEKGSEIVQFNILFVDLSGFLKQKEAFEEHGIFTKISKLIFSKQKLNLMIQNKIVQFLEQYLKDSIRLCFIYYTSLSGLAEQNQNIFQYINQIKKTKNRSQNNSINQEEQTSNIIIKINNKIANIKNKIETEKKEFKLKLRNIESLIGTDFDIEKILSKSSRNESNIFKKQRQAVDQIQSVLKITQQQNRKINNLNKQYIKLCKQNANKRTNQFNELKIIKKQIIELQQQKKKTEINIQRKKIFLQQQQENQILNIKKERQKLLDKHKDFAKTLNAKSLKLTPLKKLDLKQYHENALIKHNQYFNKKIEVHQLQNQKILKLTEENLKKQLQLFQQSIRKDGEKYKNKNEKQQVLQNLYLQFKYNAQLIEKISKLNSKFMNTKMDAKQLNSYLNLNENDFPILMENGDKQNNRIKMLKQQISYLQQQHNIYQ